MFAAARDRANRDPISPARYRRAVRFPAATLRGVQGGGARYSAAPNTLSAMPIARRLITSSDLRFIHEDEIKRGRYRTP